VTFQPLRAVVAFTSTSATKPLPHELPARRLAVQSPEPDVLVG
jgi:hypothetical protein